MLGSRGGYTIVEVMIVLSVTGLLFITAVLTFQGQQGKTNLSQSLYDLASRIQSYASEVSSGVYPTAIQNYSCSPSSGRPVLAAAGQSTLGSNDGCLFVGRAIQVTQGSPATAANSNKLLAYSVLGLRLDSAGNPTTSFTTAALTPACKGSCGAAANWVLYDTYTLPPGEYFTGSQLQDQSGNSAATAFAGIVGLYNQISDSSSNNSLNTSLDMRGYNFKDTAVAGTKEQGCIEESSCTPSLDNAYKWLICVQNGANTGSVTVSSNPAGVTTSVNAGACAWS